jgi:hypothetical protein
VPVRIEAYRGSTKLLSINLMMADEFTVGEQLVAIPPQKILHSSTSLLAQLAKEAAGLSGEE